MPRTPARAYAEKGRRLLWWRLFMLFLMLAALSFSYYRRNFSGKPVQLFAAWRATRVVKRTVTVPYYTPVPVREISLEIPGNSASVP